MQSDIIVRLHSRSDEEMPAGAVATVTLEGVGGTYQSKLLKGARMVRFDAVEIGRYDLGVTVESAGVEIGTYSYFLNLGEEVGDVTVQVDYRRADLVVEAALETSLNRRYTGIAGFDSVACLDDGADKTLRFSLDLLTDGDQLKLEFNRGQGDTLTLSGRLAPDSSPISAGGTLESSDGITGTWGLSHLSEPSPGAVAIAVAIDIPPRSCRTTLEFAGLVEDTRRGKVYGSREAFASVAVVGHGLTHAVTLGAGEPLARFEALLVGPYDVLIDVRDGELAVASHRESVVLGTDGARVGTTFVTEWPLPGSAPLVSRHDYRLQAHTFAGKSVVSNGPPECTGSIPLVDTTSLTLTALDQVLALKFDSFYGGILELNGVAGAEDEAFIASGTYRSSDNSLGTWEIKRIAMPTPRSVAMLVTFENETDACHADYLFAGLR